MDLALHAPHLQVFVQELGQQMPAVGGRTDQHVVGRRAHRAVQDHLERLVAGLVLVERQIIAEQDEALPQPIQQIHDIGQIHQIVLPDLDEPQAHPITHKTSCPAGAPHGMKMGSGIFKSDIMPRRGTTRHENGERHFQVSEIEIEGFA